MVNILNFFVPKEEKFFDMMKEQADNILHGAEKFNNFIKDFNQLNPSQKEERIKELKDIEHKGDEITHYIIDTLNKTFLTPIDREDIHQTIVKMDDVLDLIYETSKKFELYGINKVDNYILEFSNIILKCMQEIHNVILSLKGAKNIKEFCIKLHTLENQADEIHDTAMSKLFNNGMKEIEIIKFKDIYDFLEEIVDTAEDLANVIEGIVVKHA